MQNLKLKVSYLFFFIFLIISSNLHSFKAMADQDCLKSQKCIEQIKLQLINLFEKDQKGLTSGPLDMDLINKKNIENQKELKAIIQKVGWPAAHIFGPQAAEGASIVAIHAINDPEFQQTILISMEKLFNTEGFDKQDYALLYDKIAIGKGQPQRYGTQGICRGKTKTWEFKPIETSDVSITNALRKNMGIPPLENYADLMANMACEKFHMWDTETKQSK